MKFKADENLGKRALALVRSAGHDIVSVRDQALGGATDELIYAVCVKEGRVILTLDHDFGNVLRFPPERGHGIVVLEVPPRASPDAILRVVRDLLSFLGVRSLKNELWIVEPGRVRMHQQEIDLDESETS